MYIARTAEIYIQRRTRLPQTKFSVSYTGITRLWEVRFLVDKDKKLYVPCCERHLTHQLSCSIYGKIRHSCIFISYIATPIAHHLFCPGKFFRRASKEFELIININKVLRQNTFYTRYANMRKVRLTHFYLSSLLYTFLST